MLRTTIGIGFLALGLGACELTVDIDLPKEDPLLVVNSFFTPDDEWRVHISDARSLAEGRNAINHIADAIVQIESLNGGGRMELDHSTGGHYTTNGSRPVEGGAYTLRVSADGYESIQAMDVVPARIEASHTLVMPATSEPSWWDGFDASELHLSAEVTITLNDVPDLANYYRLIVLIEHNELDDAVLWLYDIRESSILADHADPLESASDEALFVEEAIFTDKSFNGESVEFTLTVHVPTWMCAYQGRRGVNETCTVIVQLKRISEAYYNYATTYQLQRWYGGDGVSEPVQVATNIDNGLGVFAAYNSYEIVLEPEE